MSLLVPSDALVEILNLVLNQNLRLKLFANDHTPVIGDTVASLTEVTGGGYAEVVLTFAEWTVTGAEQTVAQYSALQDFEFTGATGGSGEIYGYFITNDDEDILLWEQRFPEDSVPFVPQNGSVIRVRPRITNQNIEE